MPSAIFALLSRCLVLLLMAGSCLVQATERPVTMVYRGDSRAPAEIDSSGGFLPFGYARSEPDGFSIYHHVGGGIHQGNTQYVSTTSDAQRAEVFARQPFSDPKKLRMRFRALKTYVYHIQPTRNFISVRQTLSHFDLYPGDEELVALGGIRWEQVRGWTEAKVVGKTVAGEKKPDLKITKYVPNPKYDASFDGFTASGAVPQLAGFPSYHPGRREAPWVAYLPAAGRTIKDQAEDFMASIKDEVRWSGRFPLFAPAGGAKAAPVPKENNAPTADGWTQPKHCKRGDAGCIPEMQAPGTSPGDEQQRLRTMEEGQSALTADEKVDFGALGSGAQASELEAAVGKASVSVTESSNRFISPKLAKGLGFVQAAQLVTAIVDSATTRLNNIMRHDLEADFQHRDWPALINNMSSLLSGVAEDTVPGYTELEQLTRELKSRIHAVGGQTMLDKIVQSLGVLQDYTTKVEVTLLEHYMPGVPEMMERYKQGLKEFREFKGAAEETGLQKAERAAVVIGKGVVRTVNDILRDWVPGYKEATDAVADEVSTFVQDMSRHHRDDERFWDVFKRGRTLPVKLVGDALHRFVQDTLPGEKQAEHALVATGSGTARPGEKSSSEPSASASRSQDPAVPTQSDWKHSIYGGLINTHCTKLCGVACRRRFHRRRTVDDGRKLIEAQNGAVDELCRRGDNQSQAKAQCQSECVAGLEPWSASSPEDFTQLLCSRECYQDGQVGVGCVLSCSSKIMYKMFI